MAQQIPFTAVTVAVNILKLVTLETLTRGIPNTPIPASSSVTLSSSQKKPYIKVSRISSFYSSNDSVSQIKSFSTFAFFRIRS